MGIPHLETITKIAFVSISTSIAIVTLACGTVSSNCRTTDLVRTDIQNGVEKRYQLERPIKLCTGKDPEQQVLTIYDCDRIGIMQNKNINLITGEKKEWDTEVYSCDLK